MSEKRWVSKGPFEPGPPIQRAPHIERRRRLIRRTLEAVETNATGVYLHFSGGLIYGPVDTDDADVFTLEDVADA